MDVRGGGRVYSMILLQYVSSLFIEMAMNI